MSHIDEIEYMTLTATEHKIDLDDAIVRTLNVLAHRPADPNIYIPVQRPECSTLIVMDRGTTVWDGEQWDPKDPWLADIINEAAEGDPVLSWAYGIGIGALTQVTAGYGADGTHKSVGFVCGVPAEIEMPKEVVTYFDATSRVLWGAAWSPLP